MYNKVKKILHYIFLTLFAVFIPYSTDAQTSTEPIKLPIPFISQIPDGKWVLPYSMACEEASIVMVDEYYAGKYRSIEKNKAKELMQPYFEYQNTRYGTNRDSNAIRTANIIQAMARNFDSRVVENPTIEDILAELEAGRPVISFHHGYSLDNKNINFINSPSSFHVIVLVGYDAQRKIFFTHEPAMLKGDYYEYSFDIIMNSLKDFNHETNKTEGPPRVLFTSDKTHQNVSNVVQNTNTTTKYNFQSLLEQITEGTQEPTQSKLVIWWKTLRLGLEKLFA